VSLQDQYEIHLSGMWGHIVEGHCLLSDKTTDVFKQILDIVKPKHIFEIGFNAGHSAYGFLSLDEEVKVDSIDICQHRYTIPCAKKVEQLFEGRFRFGNKDSLTVQSGTLKGYDLVYIDGDHKFESFRSDYQLCVDADIEWILVDDTNLFRDINAFVEHADQSTSGRHPYKIHSRFHVDNELWIRKPEMEDKYKETEMVLLKRERDEEV